jgi:tetratricopeptide (TPR) repeat protein
VAGDYKNARNILLQHRFHTYEGGEGNLTQHHAWLYFLSAKECISKGDLTGAKQMLLDGLVFPANYGEEKNYFVNDAPIYLALYELEKDEKYLELANTTKGAPTVHSYYQCRALKKMGREADAVDLTEKLKVIGENKIRNAAVNDYYGVGAPAYPPFGYDVAKAHTTDGMILLAFAALAVGDTDEAKTLIDEIAKIDQCHFMLYLLRLLTIAE